MPKVRENGKGRVFEGCVLICLFGIFRYVSRLASGGQLLPAYLLVSPRDVARSDSPPRAMSDVKNIDLLLFFEHAVDHAIDVRFATV